MEYFVYILRSKIDDSYYIGWTSDLEDRINRHNSGRTSYTRRKIPWELVYKEVYSDKSVAIKREKEIKRYKSRKQIERLLKHDRGVEQSGSSSGS